MKNIYILFLLLTSTFISAQSFPHSWVGDYSGNLEIYAVDSILMNVKMDLNVQPTETDSIFSWVITYKMEGRDADIRKYELHIKDKSKGLYVIDEKNGIIIESYLKSDILTSCFTVMESFIIATYTKVKDEIVFEIISGKTDPVSVTGETKMEDEDIPRVETFPINGRQKAILSKK